MLLPSQCWQCKHLLPVCHLSENLVLLWIEPFNFDVFQSTSFGLLLFTFEVLFKKCFPTSGLPKSSLETLQQHPNWTREQWSLLASCLLLCHLCCKPSLGIWATQRDPDCFLSFPTQTWPVLFQHRMLPLLAHPLSCHTVSSFHNALSSSLN